MKKGIMLVATFVAAVCFNDLSAARLSVTVDNLSSDYVAVFPAKDIKMQRVDTALPLNGFMVPQTIKGAKFAIDLDENQKLYACTKSRCAPVKTLFTDVYIKVNQQGQLY